MTDANYFYEFSRELEEIKQQKRMVQSKSPEEDPSPQRRPEKDENHMKKNAELVSNWGSYNK